MLVYTVSQLLELSDGSVPEAFKGIIKKVYKTNESKPDSAKKWTLQKVILAEDGKEIEMMLSDRPPLGREAEGSRIYATCERNEKGLFGLKRKVNEWKDRVTPQVWVYKGADVSVDPQDKPLAQQTDRQPATQNENHFSQEPPPNSDDGPSAADRRNAEIKRFNLKLGRNVAGLNRCFDAAFKMVEDIDERAKASGHAGYSPSASDIKEMATTLFIQSCWNEKVGDLPDFPVKPFQAYEQTSTEKPPFQ